MYGYIILVVLADIASNVNANCPEVEPVKNFDLKAYGNGLWYEVARYLNVAEKGGNCGATNYKLDGDVLIINHTDVHNNKLRSITGSAKLAEDAGNTGKLVFTLPYGVSGANVNAILWVLGTDYKSYSVAYSCKYDEQKESRQDFAWVLSRSKTLDSDAKSAVDNILKESSVIDRSKLLWPDFSYEVCYVEA